MSSSVYALPLRIERLYSRGLAVAVVVVHGLAITVLLPLDMAWWWKCLIAVAVIVQGVFTWRRHVSLAAAGAVRTLVWKSEGEWELTRVDGATHSARLRRASYVQPALAVLRFKLEGGGLCAVLLPSDGVEPETHRRLRVGLRLQAEVV